jgi:hypothetical protein
MSIEFVIIPFSEDLEGYVYYIKSKIIQAVKTHVKIELDLDYKTSYANKLIKWKNKGYYIICIDTEIIESNIIKVRFYGKGSKKNQNAFR